MSSVNGRRSAAAGSVVLFAWMLWALFSGPVYDFEASEYQDDVPAFEVRCEPMLWGASWVGGNYASSIDGYTKTYDVTEGLEPRSDLFRSEWEQRNPGEEFDPAEAQDYVDDEIVRELNGLCRDGRTSQAGMMGMLAVPVAVLGVVGFTGRRKDDGPDGARFAPGSATPGPDANTLAGTGTPARPAGDPAPGTPGTPGTPGDATDGTAPRP